jgi:hypothetical protein
MTERSGGFTPNQALPSFGDIADTIVSPTLSVVKSRLSLDLRFGEAQVHQRL